MTSDNHDDQMRDVGEADSEIEAELRLVAGYWAASTPASPPYPADFESAQHEAAPTGNRGHRPALEIDQLEAVPRREVHPRRSSRKWIAAVAAGVALVAGGAWLASGADEEAITLVDESEVATPQRPTPVPRSTEEPSQPPTALPERGESLQETTPEANPQTEPWLDRSVDLVSWGETGIMIHRADGTTETVSNQPASYAVMFEAGPVAYQPASDRIEFVEEPGREPGSIVAADGERVRLLDGHFDGKPTILATRSAFTNPEVADTRLLLIDLVSGEETDLGSVGGWEKRIAAGEFALDGRLIVLHQTDGAPNRLLILDRDGRTKHNGQLRSATDVTIAARGGDVLVIEPVSEHQELQISAFSLWDTEPGVVTSVPMKIDGVDVDGFACETARFSRDRTIARLVCNRRSGPPLDIGLGTRPFPARCARSARAPTDDSRTTTLRTGPSRARSSSMTDPACGRR